MGNGLPKESNVGEWRRRLVGRRKCVFKWFSRRQCVQRGVGLHGPGGKISFLLKDWDLAKVALSCHMALDMLCQEVQEAWWWVLLRGACCHGMSALLSPWTGRDSSGEGCGERNQSISGKEARRSWWIERACWYPSFQLLLECVHLVPFLE